ncbi:tRNA (adenosine(37)-N6)-threonylcarbamoyltransferase complex transferase subunit TsaD [Candidatus Saccharibacteria bacterium]|nr:tRNA (adenosine(37)-N6)-threonylcarbamoyltransferase complex transferase subunit TsaD [Candidatus Saccharibacteria bacterium]
MLILGIETSCDETAASVVRDGVEILSNVVVSQIDIFAEYGGVIPEVAARSHLEAMMPVVDKALSDAGCSWDDIDAIAVTHAPGLLGSLLIGTLTARTLAILHDKPLYAVHHLKSHVYANWLTLETNFTDSRAASARPVATGERRLSSRCRAPYSLESSKISFPVLALVVSGGHTQILYMPSHNQFEIIGTTQDDAVGECFDKVAKILGLPYPGGPAIAKAALDGDANKYVLPHPKVTGLDFSFSGLKTAVLRAVQKEVGVPISYPSHKLKELLNPQQVADFAASFQKTAVEILSEKLKMALGQYPEVQSVVVAGGVSANKALREALPEAYFPAPSLSGDNGAMVAAAAYYEILSGVKPTDPYSLNIYPRISIEN